jgi:hypothetical protein
MKRVAIPDNQTALESPEKPVEQLAAPARYMGSHGQPNEPQSRSTASGTKEDSATNNVVVPCMFSGYSQRFIPRVSSGRSPCFEGNENNGINPGSEADMGKPPENSVVCKLSDGYLIGDRMVDGIETSVLVAINAPAQQIVRANGLRYVEVKVLIQLIPDSNNDTLATIRESQEAQISCV